MCIRDSFIEVKQELLQEDAHESDMERHDIFVKVRVCALHILMFIVAHYFL